MLRDDVGWLLDLYGPFTWNVSEFADESAHLLVGYPFAPLDSIPRAPFVAAFLAALGYAVAAAAWSLWRRRGRWRPSRPDVLLALVPLAVIGGLLFDSVRSDHDLVSARNAMAAFPFVAILIGRLVARLPRRQGLAAGAVLLAALAVGAVTALGDRGQRPRFRDAAAYIERSARPGDVVVDRSPFDAYGELGPRAHVASRGPARRRHHAHRCQACRRHRGPRRARGAGRRTPRRRVFVVQNFAGEPPLPRTIGAGYRRLGARVFPGLLPVTVTRYGRD